MKLVKNILILAFLGLNIFFLYRTLTIHDARFGWGMFTACIDYSIEYKWILNDGTRIRYAPPDLKGIDAINKLAPGGHLTCHGEGSVLTWTQSFGQYIVQHYAPPGTRALEITLTMSVNKGTPKKHVLNFNAG